MKKNKNMIKALKNKYVYVDIDGTLAEYRFNDHISANDGTANGQTMKEIEYHIFLHSRPLKTVIRILEKAKTKKIYICGAIICGVLDSQMVRRSEHIQKRLFRAK